MTTEMKGIKEVSEYIEEQLRAALANNGAQRDDEWLRCLYNAYHARFLSDNGKIWENGRLMIPFSLSAFGIYAMREPSIWATVVLAVASTALLFVWLVNAESHRAFQDKSIAWLAAIERIVVDSKFDVPLKVGDSGDKVGSWLSQPAAVRNSIRYLCFGFPVAWLIVLLRAALVD